MKVHPAASMHLLFKVGEGSKRAVCEGDLDALEVPLQPRNASDDARMGMQQPRASVWMQQVQANLTVRTVACTHGCLFLAEMECGEKHESWWQLQIRSISHMLQLR